MSRGDCNFFSESMRRTLQARTTSLEYVVNNPGQALPVAFDRFSEILLHPAWRIAAAKINDPRIILSIDEDVCGFGISPNDPGLVETCYGFFNFSSPVLPD